MRNRGSFLTPILKPALLHHLNVCVCMYIYCVLCTLYSWPLVLTYLLSTNVSSLLCPPVQCLFFTPPSLNDPSTSQSHPLSLYKAHFQKCVLTQYSTWKIKTATFSETFVLSPQLHGLTRQETIVFNIPMYFKAQAAEYVQSVTLAAPSFCICPWIFISWLLYRKTPTVCTHAIRFLRTFVTGLQTSVTEIS
jgi:hypothetical protein